MRVLIELLSIQDAERSLINNYIIQGLIYNLLKDTDFSWIHQYKGFKFFNFSNMFPIENFKVGRIYNIIISSPNKKLINIIFKKLKSKDEIRFGTLYFKVKKVKKFDIKLKFPWETATPIILMREKVVYLTDGLKTFKVRTTNNVHILRQFKKRNIKIESKTREIDFNKLKYLDKNKFFISKIDDIYYSFKKGDSMLNWLEDLKTNSIIKYRSYTGNEFHFEEPIFDNLEFRREVPIRVRIKNRGEVTYVGTLWKKLDVMRRLDKEENKFYKFLLDTGLGILNSMGFGFVNPKNNRKSNYLNL